MSPYLAAIAIYAYAGLWLAWPTLSPSNTRGKPAWANLIAFVLSLVLWAVIFPFHVIAAEKQRAKNAGRNALLDKLVSASKEKDNTDA